MNIFSVQLTGQNMSKLGLCSGIADYMKDLKYTANPYTNLSVSLWHS